MLKEALIGTYIPLGTRLSTGTYSSTAEQTVTTTKSTVVFVYDVRTYMFMLFTCVASFFYRSFMHDLMDIIRRAYGVHLVQQ